MASIRSHHFMANRWGNIGNSGWLYFSGLQNHCRWWLQPWNSKTLIPWKESYDQPRQHIKKWRHYFANKGPSSQGYGFSSGHVWLWKLDCEENWMPKNLFIELGAGEDSLESLGLQGDTASPSKRRSVLVFIGRTDVEAENSNTLATWYEELTLGKDPDAGKVWGQKEKGMAEDEMIGWHHWLNGRGFVWTPGVGDEQEGLACCSPWGPKESDMTEKLNWTELNWILKKPFNIYFKCKATQIYFNWAIFSNIFVNILQKECSTE